MGTAINRRLLESNFSLTVQDITFPSTQIGDAVSGRAADTAWALNDTVVFKGKLKHILIFALMAFDVASVAINEKFELVGERKFLNVENLTGADIVGVIDLDPTAGEGIVLADDVTYLDKLTNNYRLGFTDQKNIIAELKSDPTTKVLYRGTVLEALAYSLQVHATLNEVVYTLFDFALMDVAAGVSKGMDYLAISGNLGPIELEPAHTTLANLILSATQC
jgi:hypothetical protein